MIVFGYGRCQNSINKAMQKKGFYCQFTHAVGMAKRGDMRPVLMSTVPHFLHCFYARSDNAGDLPVPSPRVMRVVGPVRLLFAGGRRMP